MGQSLREFSYRIYTMPGRAFTVVLDSIEDARSIAEGMVKCGTRLGIRRLSHRNAVTHGWTFEPATKQWVEIS